MYKEVKAILMGIESAADQVEAIMAYALASTEKKVQDALMVSYFLPLAYSGLLPDNAPKDAVNLAKDIPNGSGFQVQGKEVIDLSAACAKKILGLCAKEVGDLLNETLLENQPEEYLRLMKERGYFMGVSSLISDEKVSGNELKDMVKPRGFIKISGKDGDISIHTSEKLAINEDNPGQLIFKTDNGNSCNVDFEVVGKARGIIGAFNSLSDFQFAYFYYDVAAKQLIMEQHVFNNKRKSNYVKVFEHGTLVF